MEKNIETLDHVFEETNNTFDHSQEKIDVVQTTILNRNVPEIRFNPFKTEWIEILLGEYFTIKNGLNKGKEYFGHGIKILNYMDVNSNVLNNENTIKGKVDVSKDEIKRYNIKKNDLFFTRTSETSEEIGLTSTYMGIPINCVFSGFILRARPKNNKINSLFYAYYFRNPKMRNTIIKYSSITTRALITGHNLSQIKIKLPSLNEQNKIANFLYLIDRKIMLLEKQSILYNKMYKSLKIQIFTRNLRFKNKDNSYFIKWKVKKVKDLFKLSRGHIIPKTDIKKNKMNEYIYPVYSSQTYNKGIMGYYNNYDFEGDHITWTTDGANAGKTVHRSGKFKCSNVCGILTPKKKYEGMANKYIANYIDSISYKYVSYVGNPKLMNKVMSEIRIKVPSLEEQIIISNLFNIFNNKINLLKKEKYCYEKFKKSLLQQMFI